MKQEIERKKMLCRRIAVVCACSFLFSLLSLMRNLIPPLAEAFGNAPVGCTEVVLRGLFSVGAVLFGVYAAMNCKKRWLYAVSLGLFALSYALNLSLGIAGGGVAFLAVAREAVFCAVPLFLLIDCLRRDKLPRVSLLLVECFTLCQLANVLYLAIAKSLWLGIVNCGGLCLSLAFLLYYFPMSKTASAEVGK